MLLRITCLVVLLGALPAHADEASNPLFGEAASGQGGPATPVATSSDTEPLASPAQTTPEMWFYTQEQKRLDDPKQIMRRKSQQEGAQRRQRIAARKWFGFSNMRPTANPIPCMASYSPGWAGNHWDPFRWSGVGGTVPVARTTTIVYTGTPSQP